MHRYRRVPYEPIFKFGVKVNHIAKHISEEELYNIFSQFGKCTIAVHDAADEKYAFVNYFSDQDAHDAVYKMNGCILQGKQISVKLQTAYSIP